MSMKVLWFEVTTPSGYNKSSTVVAGWQDSLEEIVRENPQIELSISFVSNFTANTSKTEGNVTYLPMCINYDIVEKFQSQYCWDIYARKLVVEMKRVISIVQPDIIHVFGTEWLFGIIAQHVGTPVVIHIMGAAIPYVNAYCPPNFCYSDTFSKKRPFDCIRRILAQKKLESWASNEKEVWTAVKYYMGRTQWDRSISSILHPGRIYFHVDEALRPLFLKEGKSWKNVNRGKLQLITVGGSSFWKGPDMLLKTAHILTCMNIDFEWKIVGNMSDKVRLSVEHKLGYRFDGNNVRILGYTQPDELVRLLCDSTMYVHTAYIENSPNSICEAQILGVPIISTNVGGIADIVGNNGILVPANDPWQMANAIIGLSKDNALMEKYSESGKTEAKRRHDPKSILHDLTECYTHILEVEKN